MVASILLFLSFINMVSFRLRIESWNWGLIKIGVSQFSELI